MSLTSTGLSLTHQVTVQRNQTGDAAWGVAAAPDWQDHLVGLACRYWATAGRERVTAETETVVEDMRLIVQLGTDVTVGDRLGDITSRDVTLVSGPVGIRAVLATDDHLELVLERIS